MTVYTSGVWVVKPGHEDEFVRLWGELADWTVTQFPGARGTLLRDRERPQRFVSFGPWGDTDEIARWRAAPEWQQIVGEIQALLESFEPGVFDVAREAG